MAQRRADGISGIVQKRYWREADGRAVVTAWQRSGKPLSIFARDHGVEPGRISRWASRLGARSRRTVRFHPVRLVEARRGGDRREAIEVVLVDGRRVRVPEGFAAEDLERVLAVLEGGA